MLTRTRISTKNIRKTLCNKPPLRLGNRVELRSEDQTFHPPIRDQTSLRDCVKNETITARRRA